MQYALEPAASEALDDIFVYSRDSWGQEQAERYVQGIFGRLSDIADRKVHWRPIPDGTGTIGFYTKYKRHYIYWRLSADDRIAIFAILHDRMDQPRRLHSSE